MLDNPRLGGLETPTIAPSASSFVQPPTLVEESESEHLEALVIFDFTATSEFELGVHGMLFPFYVCTQVLTNGLKYCYVDGMKVRILEPDDGSGWVKVADQDGNSGLVPASYIQTAQGGSADTDSGDSERGTLFDT